jgi:hypothetical protein
MTAPWVCALEHEEVTVSSIDPQAAKSPVSRIFLLALGLVVAGCAGGTGSSAATNAGLTAASPSELGSAESSIAGADLVGTWTRTQECEGMLAAFQEAGLAESQLDWIIGNWVGDPADVEVHTDDICADARPAEEHFHFFTADGQFGSYDARGEQVDDGDYAVVDADTLSFPSHSTEFGYDGDILVTYTVSGDSAEFEVQVPDVCDDACSLAHAWALSAFFGPEPWTRTD